MDFAEIIGSIIGYTFASFIPIILFQIMWEFVLFQRVLDDPVKGKLASSIAAYLTFSTLFGVSKTLVGPFDFSGFFTFSLGGIAVGLVAIRRGFKIAEKIASEKRVEDVFN